MKVDQRVKINPKFISVIYDVNTGIYHPVLWHLNKSRLVNIINAEKLTVKEVTSIFPDCAAPSADCGNCKSCVPLIQDMNVKGQRSIYVEYGVTYRGISLAVWLPENMLLPVNRTAFQVLSNLT